MSEIGKLEQIDITNQAKKAYLDYAMSVIVSRALPDVRDGLKPVHRRILFAMHEMGLNPAAKYAKSAKIVGETMGKYHPHGDMAIYDSLVRLAQDFSMRYPLVDGQGNFGSMDGDSAAAMRYTEAKLTHLAVEMLFDIEKDTVEYIPNFDGTLKEPVYLPSKLPNLLLMGSEGIAVGMATKIPPHNLGEIIDAVIFTISNTTHQKIEGARVQKDATQMTDEEIQHLKPSFSLTSDVTVDQLLEFVKGPDFPTGGAIFDINEIKNVYRTGRGKILIRGIAEIEDIGQGKNAIIIRELPYQVNKSVLVARIAELAKDKKLEGLSDLRDESDRQGIRVVIELKRDVSPRKILNNLFKLTSLQTSFPANIVALVDGVPRTLNLKVMLDEYIYHRFTVITRRSEFELKQAKARLHILDGLIIAVNNIDEIVEIIKKSKNVDEARTKLITRFKLSEIQANAILDMQLRRLTGLEREKLEDEWKMTKELIDYIEELLTNPKKMLQVVGDELKKIKEKYADARRTRVYKSKVDEFSEEDLIQNEPTVITITQTGYIKRQSMASFKTQARGGKGVRGMTTKEEDAIDHILYAQTHDFILFFTNLGKVYQTRVYEMAEASRVSKGQAIVNLLDITQGEKIQSILTYNPKEKAANTYIFLATKKGVIKKTKIDDFKNIRRGGIIAIKIDKDDALEWAKLSSGEDDILLITKNGKIICFNEKQVRSTGRSSQGVRGIKLIGDDVVVGLDLISGGGKTAELLVIAENGLGKRTKVSEVRNQKRGGQGVRVAHISEKTGKLVFSNVLEKENREVIITSKKGQVVKIPLSSTPLLSRNAQGVILMRFSDKSDKVASATTLGGQE
ncbi:MAG: DNA gyrase subunit A [Candidatus Levybacteria bacterium CG_4_10_14_0_2_um_filter_36_16]|nr:MAG: DNA gyrase subunit A [Candidatus Levybacteria bacterium CG2_30_37_29]PIR78767.1 MAG: DNA gyrase subunit A [Candidatus Levybacteria bacterium CG10_big_fil_rev_8_21_14_0_10_36_30]PIZ96483.1 MAG: DNA gyrase subunit A [Candidatus Levybacteria bacterium CG_4_10_14_0_2_um_filter_36_16]PJA90442.1 MAG: DNA gyrase subunit A [Candidatus Levybacteria bacterium CG_4_9_14_3_um_filter_36_7]